MARLKEILALQEYYTEKANHSLTGSIETVLVEGRSLKKRQISGHGDQIPANRSQTAANGNQTTANGKQIYANGSQADENGNTTRDLPQMTGRTESGKIVHFHAENIEQGQMIDIKIEHAYPHSLWGSVHGCMANQISK